MPNVILQDLNAIIHGTSREGLEYDVAHVSILLKTDQPIPPEMIWSVPHIEEIPEKAVNLLKDGTTPIYPMLRTKLRHEIDNILTDIDSNNINNSLNDIEKALLLTCMHPTEMKPLDGQPCKYIISYKYRLYPISLNTFDFKVLLPFDGLAMAPGGKLQITLVAPIGAKINPAITDAKDFNGQSVANETITPITITNKNVVSFEITHDPIFTIRYNY